MKRYTLGVVPTKEYSCIIRKALESPIYFKSLLEKNKDKLNSTAYKKAKAASEKLCQMTNMSDTILATISYIFYRLDEVTPLALQKISTLLHNLTHIHPNHPNHHYNQIV